jgi:hypothetical protein
MPAQAEVDRPRFEPAGDLSTVDGLLQYLQVADAPIDLQRAAIGKAMKHAILHDHVRRLGPQLIERSLVWVSSTPEAPKTAVDGR